MKEIVSFVIFFYQLALSRILKSALGVSFFCRFKPTCSEYTRCTILRYGILRGTYLSLARLLRCQPFNNSF